MIGYINGGRDVHCVGVRQDLGVINNIITSVVLPV